MSCTPPIYTYQISTCLEKGVYTYNQISANNTARGYLVIENKHERTQLSGQELLPPLPPSDF